MTQTVKTPGYNHRLAIFFKVTSKGQKKAYYWMIKYQRSFPLPVKDAEMFIAQDLADQIADPR